MAIASRWNSLVKGIGLNARLAIIVVLVLVPFLLFVAWDSRSEAKATERAAFERAASSAHLAAHHLEERARSLTLVARAIAAHAGKNLADAAGTDAYLLEFAPLLGEDIGRLQVVDSQGQVIAAARAPRERHNEFQYAGETWFDDAIRTRSVRWSDILASPASGNPTLVMAYPILSDAVPSVVGVVAASIDLEIVAKGLATNLQRNRMICILDGAGGIVSRLKFHDGTEVAPTVDATFAKSALFATPESSEGRAWLEANGTRYATAATRVAGLPWSVAIGIPQEDVTGLVWAEAGRRFAATLLFAAFAGALAFWTARSVVRPLGAIRDGLRRFVAGESGVRVPVVGGGEVARLERDFNTTIAEIERGREALEGSEARHRGLVALSSDWQWETDAEHRFAYQSEQTEARGGVAREQAIGQRRWELEGVDEADPLWAAHRADLEAHRPFRDFEYRRALADGSLGWLSVSGEPMFDAAGRFVGYRGTARNVTERRTAEHALRESEERFKQLAELSNDWFWETDTEHRFSKISQEVEFGTGIQHVGLRRWELPGVDGAEARWDAHRIDLAEHRPFREFEFTRRDADGELVWCSINGAPRFGADGAFRGYRGTGRYITDRKKSEQAARDAANQLQLIAENVPAMIAYTDATPRYRYANTAYAEFYGGAGANPIGRTVREFIGEDAWRDAEPRLERGLRGETVSYETRRRTANGTWRDVEVTTRPHRDQSGRVRGLYTMLIDISERRRSEAELRLRNRALDSSVNAVVITEHEATDFHITYVNPAFERITGYSAAEALGRNPRFLYGDEHDQPGLTELRLALRERREATALLRNYRKDGAPWWCELRVAPVHDDSGEVTNYVGISSDVSARVGYEQELERHANYDTLTGLANRNLLGDRIAQGLAQARRAGTMAAVLFIDIDHFKRINDGLGHAVGDAVLRAIADRLASVMRAGDTVARVGGDEFIVVIENLKHETDAARIAQKVREAVGAPLRIEDQELVLTESIGIALYPRDGADAEELMRNADMAMYRAKEEGRDSVQYFTAELNERVVRFTRIERDLRSAVAQNAFELYYQPVLDLRTRAWVGAEALIRWRRADGSMVSPAEFIPVAEESGLIVPIGQWVLESAARQARLWQPAGSAPFVISLNLSARQFRDPGLLDKVRAAIEAAGVAPSLIKLEITESTVMQNAAVATATLRELHAFGVQLAVDDFGTGYSSLAYLKRFPIDTLKIDRAFVAGLPDDTDDRAICRGVIDLAHGLGLDVVAEGVETPAQAETLGALGCDFVQGFLFGRPVPAAHFETQRNANAVPPRAA